MMKVSKSADDAKIKKLKANNQQIEKDLDKLKSNCAREKKADVDKAESAVKSLEYKNKNAVTKLQEESSKKDALLEKERKGRAYDKKLLEDKLKSLTAQLEEARNGQDDCIPSMYI